MHNLIFSTLAIPGKLELDTLLLVESLRSHGGELADNPIWVLVPKELGPLSEPTQVKLSQLQAIVIPSETEPETYKFPFALKTLTAAALETLALGQTKRLVYMDRDTIVLQEPTEFLISAEKKLGYRPVHHKLIGSTWDSALDSFWALVYEVCDVPDENLFPMITHTGEQIRPYFNAGIYIIRPEIGLLTQWREMFLKWYQHPQFKVYYEEDQLYAIFMHQAIFSGTLLQNLKPEEMTELSSKVNYPLHLHETVPIDQRPETVDELITVRYEQIFDKSDWTQLPFTACIKKWLLKQPRVQPQEAEV